MYIINKKIILKIIFVLLISTLFSGCRKPSISTSSLSEEDIVIQILHHEFDDIENKEARFLGFIVSIDNKEIKKEDITVEIKNLDSFCNIDKDLTNDYKYTRAFFNSKITLDDDYINFVEYYVIETNHDLYKSLQDNLEIIVKDETQEIMINGFIFVEI